MIKHLQLSPFILRCLVEGAMGIFGLIYFTIMSESNYERNQRLRRERIAFSRSKGTHTKEEWKQMQDYFNHTCALCLGEKGYPFVDRDHIIPIYQGGSDSIRNLQPLCLSCNSSKGPDSTDLRPRLAAYLGKELPEAYTNPY